jgi:hypothetical protein
MVGRASEEDPELRPPVASQSDRRSHPIARPEDSGDDRKINRPNALHRHNQI